MAIRVIVNGAQGKMGSLACETLKSHPDFMLVGALTRHDNLRKEIVEKQAEIVVDLTRADSVYENSLTIIESKAHPVIGTTGLDAKEIESLKNYCEKAQLGGIIVPNFSISAVLMMRFAAEAARLLPDVEIIEAHHPQKFDAPSGTALKTAEMIAAARGPSANSITEVEENPKARGTVHCGVHLHALRLAGVVAQQQVIFGNRGETLAITHNCIDRICFMPGIVLACQKVKTLTSLYYGLEHLIPRH